MIDWKWKTVARASRELRGKASGVYLIRQVGFLGSIVYVGESHSGRLRETMQRHFQRWKGPTSGPTYGRRTHLVAWVKTRAERAVETQNQLIADLRPRDNSAGKPQWWEIWK